MKENIKPEELAALHIEIRNAISEAIGVMEREGAKMQIIQKKPDFQNIAFLTRMRMDILHQKNKLKEVYDLMGSVLYK